MKLKTRFSFFLCLEFRLLDRITVDIISLNRLANNNVHIQCKVPKSKLRFLLYCPFYTFFQKKRSVAQKPSNRYTVDEFFDEDDEDWSASEHDDDSSWCETPAKKAIMRSRRAAEREANREAREANRTSSAHNKVNTKRALYQQAQSFIEMCAKCKCKFVLKLHTHPHL